MNLTGLSADQFAEMQHVTQTRKYTGDPYIVHPRAVRDLILKHVPLHYNAMLEAAVLHDVIEDTSTTYEDLKILFGHITADMVLALTDQVPLSAGNRTTRKWMEAVRLSNCSASVQTIKMADMIDNARSIIEHDKDFAKVYMQEMQRLVGMLTKADATLTLEAQDVVRNYYSYTEVRIA